MENSEAYEPMAAHIIGLGFCRCEDIRTKTEKGEMHKYEFMEACLRWWNSVKAFDMMLGNLKVDRGELCHVTLAIGNHVQVIDKYIEKYLGFSPILDLNLDGTAKNDKVPPNWYTLRYKHASPKFD